jgi:hypothetical protein
MWALWTVVASSLALCTLPAGAAPGPAPAAAALRVDRDPVTGTLTPAGPTSDPMLMPLWASGLRPALDRLTAVHLADGSMMVDLTGIYLDFATAHREWDGRVVAECDAAWVPEVLRPIATSPAPALGWAEQ